MTLKNFPRSDVNRDERLIPVLKNLAHHYAGPEQHQDVNSTTSNAIITPAIVEHIADRSMPLCMKNLHQALRANHHLRYGGRVQYGLFLKALGLSMEDAIAFWRKAFCHKMSLEDFNKKYAYNIRHNYGKEGKRKDYTPLSCARIINGEPPKTGDYHGCPFRHYDEAHLRSQLRGVGNDIERQDILQLVKTKQYELACKRHFEARHPGGNSDGVGNHPNRYVEESMKYHEAAQELLLGPKQ